MVSIYSIAPTSVPQATTSPLSSSIPSIVTLLPRPTKNRYPIPPSFNAAQAFDERPERLLRDCASLVRERSHGARPRELHAFMLRSALEGLGARRAESSLVRLYSQCGHICTARKLFDRMPDRDVVSWTVMLMAYANREGCENELMSLFQEMLCGGVVPNRHTITVVLRGATIDQGKQLHAYIIKMGCDSSPFVGSALVDIYSKNGVLGQAQLVFDRIENKDVVCYNCLISHYGRVGCIEGVLSVFSEMGSVGLAPNQSTCVGLLSGCANFGFIGLSKQFHGHVIVRGFSKDEIVQGVIIDMYAKCGDLEAAHKAFNRMPLNKNIVSWNSMIGAFGKHGYVKEALKLFDSMQLASVIPDYITFICLLSACSHSGLVDEGWRLFNLMINVYKIPACNEHYCCMVDLLGRAGMVCKAYEFISKNKLNFRASVWGALLGACMVKGDSEIGEIAARRLFELEPECSGSYVSLANIFAENRQWDDAMAIRELMDDRRIWKGTGYSWIEIGGDVHKFRARQGVDQPGMEEVHSLCDRLNSSICDHLLSEIFFDVKNDCTENGT